MQRHLQWIKDAIRLRSVKHGLRSKEWPRVRGEWIKDHPTCAACGESMKVQVHHKMPFHLDPSKELDRNNFISLCESKIRGDHHLHIGHLGNWKNYNSNVERDASNLLLALKQ